MCDPPFEEPELAAEKKLLDREACAAFAAWSPRPFELEMMDVLLEGAYPPTDEPWPEPE